METFLTQLHQVIPDGELKRELLMKILKEVDPSCWSDEKMDLLLKYLPDTIHVQSLAEWLYSSGGTFPGNVSKVTVGADAEKSEAESSEHLTSSKDPVGFMKNYLQDCSSSIQPEKVPPLSCSAAPVAARENQTATPPVQIQEPSERPPDPAPPGKALGRPPGAPPKGGRPGRPPGRPPAGAPPGAKAKAKAGGPAKSAPQVAGGASFADALAQQKEKLRSQAPPPNEEKPVDTLAVEAEAAARAAEAASEVAKLHELAGRTPLGVIAVDDVLAADVPAGDTPSIGRSASSVLGRGRFAAVTRARVRSAGDAGDVAVAAKRFAASSNSALCAARREADALIAIGLHPNVVELLGLVLPSPDDFVAGGQREANASPLQLLLRPSQGSLYQLLANIPEWEALSRIGQLNLLVDVGRGLCAMHGASFAHLDVKSHNVLVDGQADGTWTARICDLGSAHRVVPDGPPPPAEGTSGWTAPEILERHPALSVWPDPRLADVFSFGVVIWEVVSGPGIDHPLCGLAGDAYCAALAEGRRPPFPSAASNFDEVLLATECWKLEAQFRPTLFQATDRLVHRREVLKREAT